jgi:osmotically-inducible protein OsmY
MRGAEDSLLNEVHAALEREPRLNPHRSPIDIAQRGKDTVLLRGEVSSIEAKRLAVECARAVPSVRQVIDRLTVRPASRSGDGAMCDSVAHHLLQESAFARASIRCRRDGELGAIARTVDDADSMIDAVVSDGIITLRGHVLSLSHRRLAVVLAWWVPGCRDVIDELELRPPEEDNDDELSDAIKLVLDKDPLVHGDQISVRVRNGEAALHGVVANKEEKRMATQDAWYVEGVHNVVDGLDVHPTPPRRAGYAGAASGTR